MAFVGYKFALIKRIKFGPNRIYSIGVSAREKKKEENKSLSVYLGNVPDAAAVNGKVKFSERDNDN